MTEKYSTIKIREKQESKIVKIGSALKPAIIDDVINKWQSLVDIATKIIGVPSGLIMKLNNDTIEVFLKSKTEGNPYEVGEEAKLIYGLYCETVIGTQQKLLVPDATKSMVWKSNNPDVDINMISYLGFPVNWPDGEVFGTVCILDNKENYYNKNFENLLLNVKYSLETDLNLLMSNQELKKNNIQLNQTNQIKSKLLSLISHDIRSTIGVSREFLKLVLNKLDTIKKERLTEILTTLSETANYSYTTLEDLLSWSKNDMLQIEANKTQVNLVEVLKKVVKFYSQSIKLKEQKLTTEFYSENIIIHADEKMIETSFRNILSNAVKYTDTGGEIFIRVNSKDGKNVVEIEDTGIGMSKSTASNLFNYNKDHKKEGTSGEGSAGIGLLLMKEFLDKNGAIVHVESEIDKGTTFTIQI